MSGSSIRVIRLGGELEIGRRDEIAEALALQPDDTGVLIDLAEATYADSTTLAALLRLRAEAETRGVRLAVVIVNRQLVRLIQYAGIGQVMAVFADRGEALRALSSS